MIEWAWILLVPTGWVCWTIGGTGVPPFKKGWRRYVYPVILAGVLAAVGIVWWRWFLAVIAISFVSHLGYGDAATWGKRWLVGWAYGCSLAPLWGVTLSNGSWLLIPMSAVLFVGLLWLTRRFNRFPHKLVEGLWGGWHGAASVWLVMR